MARIVKGVKKVSRREMFRRRAEIEKKRLRRKLKLSS